MRTRNRFRGIDKAGVNINPPYKLEVMVEVVDDFVLVGCCSDFFVVHCCFFRDEFIGNVSDCTQADCQASNNGYLRDRPGLAKPCHTSIHALFIFSVSCLWLKFSLYL